MALKGNLRDFSIAQLLNLISLAHKTGTLIIDGSLGKVTVCFREGRLAYAQVAGQENGLVTVLQRANRLSASQSGILKARASELSDKALGLLLVNANYISQQEIIHSLQNHYVGILNQLFTHVEGVFRFENEALPPEDRITVRVGLENIIIDGTHRIREWEKLQEEIPSLDMALKFTDHPGTNIRNLNLSVDEWRVISFINPKNSILQIARATKTTELEIRRIVYGLLQAGLVEVVRPQSALPPSPVQPAKQAPVAATSIPEQKSLINRLIMRIRSI